MVGPAGDVHVAEKDDGVSLHLTLDVDVAEKANGVTHSSAGVYPDVGKEMDGIPVGTSRSRAGCQSGAKHHGLIRPGSGFVHEAKKAGGIRLLCVETVASVNAEEVGCQSKRLADV